MLPLPYHGFMSYMNLSILETHRMFLLWQKLILVIWNFSRTSKCPNTFMSFIYRNSYYSDRKIKIERHVQYKNFSLTETVRSNCKTSPYYIIANPSSFSYFRSHQWYWLVFSVQNYKNEETLSLCLCSKISLSFPGREFAFVQ